MHRIVAWATGSRPHPVTGDMLNPSDRLSWFTQNLIRRWAFLGLVTVLTVIVWIHAGVWRADPLTQWNLWASYLALVIESVVGIGVFGQTLRDAVLIRRMVRMEENVDSAVTEVRQIALEVRQLAREVREQAGQDLAADLETRELVRAIAARQGISLPTNSEPQEH